jgi:hypothetical protein
MAPRTRIGQLHFLMEVIRSLNGIARCAEWLYHREAMSSPNVLRWVIAAPCAVAVGVAVAFGSWHFRDTGFLKQFRGESASAQAATAAEGGGHSGGSPVPSSAPSMAFPSLTQGATVNPERQPTREEFVAILEQEKSKAANEALTSYILSQEELPKLNQTTSERAPDHPLVEELINKHNAMQSVAGNTLIPGAYGSGGLHLGGYPQHVLRDTAQVFNSPVYAPLQANARATADMSLSALMNVQGQLQSRLESGGSGSLGNILGLGNGSGLNLSNSTRRAVGNIMANALGGPGYNDGSGGGGPFMGNYMTPSVGSPTVPVGAGVVDASELAAATALVEEYRRLLPDLSEAEMKEYLRRVDTEGKVAAMQWVVQTKKAAK